MFKFRNSYCIDGRLLEYQFHFEPFEEEAYYDAKAVIRIVRVDYPAYWNVNVDIKDGIILWGFEWPPISDEAKNFINRVYKLKAFW